MVCTDVERLAEGRRDFPLTKRLAPVRSARCRSAGDRHAEATGWRIESIHPETESLP
jgi:hypothetical protein